MNKQQSMKNLIEIQQSMKDFKEMIDEKKMRAVYTSTFLHEIMETRKKLGDEETIIILQSAINAIRNENKKEAAGGEVERVLYGG